MALTLAQFFEAMDRWTGRVPLDDLSRLLGSLRLSLDEVRDQMIFGDDGYRRNPVRTGPSYEALILCWRAGQSSPIHDHRGSSCGVLVLTGTATEIAYRRTAAGQLEVMRRRKIPSGHICATQDADIHEMSNLSADGSDLVTLHLYSPPLVHMRTFERGQVLTYGSSAPARHP